MKLLIYLSLLFFICTCTNKPIQKEQLTLPFEVTGAKEALPHFQRGLLLLHNFEYDDAAEAFMQAQKIDPGFVMAYWGEAMTYNHAVWGDLDIDKARAALLKLAPSSSEREKKAKTSLELDFLKGVEILYGEGSKPDREKRYSSHMQSVYKRFPNHTEVAAFYALSLLGTKEGWSKWEPQNDEAADISESILKTNPDHPGALHYLIHSDDYPDHANEALAAANKYSKVASYAGHALHMPSHIYLALGMWDNVVASNETSWKASVDKKVTKKLDNDHLSYHSHWWLQYGYLQQGRYGKAMELLKNQVAFEKELSSPSARFHLLEMKGHYLFETDNWTDQVVSIAVKTDDLALRSRAVNDLIDGTAAFKKKNNKQLATTIARLESDISRSEQQMKANEDVTVCGVKRYVNNIVSPGDLKFCRNILFELEALKKWADGDYKGAETFFEKAIANEKGYIIGPPVLLKPVHELYGEFLLAQNRPAEALKQFEASLALAPKRVLSLKGQLNAARLIKSEKKMEMQNELKAMLKHADAEAIKGV